ncbi:centrosomal protein of 95 kDa-like [Pollicipes pollicipes]|uniref:centrosomal protein of 95 kDa-like n=1 Tax=Pollicipes pollicipes TaxID=41117 RepID=UPI001884F7DE|nr:centrosomal protein of 95 kDa-like [Pollicipes pollicipes]
MGDRKIRKKDCVRLSNKIIERCQLSVPPVTNISDIRSNLFTSLLEVLCGQLPEGVLREPVGDEEEAANVQAIINHLALDLINVDLSHISGANIIAGDPRAIYNLLEIFCGLHKYLSSTSVDKWNLEESLTETEEELSSAGSSSEEPPPDGQDAVPADDAAPEAGADAAPAAAEGDAAAAAAEAAPSTPEADQPAKTPKTAAAAPVKEEPDPVDQESALVDPGMSPEDQESSLTEVEGQEETEQEETEREETEQEDTEQEEAEQESGEQVSGEQESAEQASGEQESGDQESGEQDRESPAAEDDEPRMPRGSFVPRHFDFVEDTETSADEGTSSVEATEAEEPAPPAGDISRKLSQEMQQMRETKPESEEVSKPVEKPKPPPPAAVRSLSTAS